MPVSKPFYLSMCISICTLPAYACAGIHYCMIISGLLKFPLYSLNAPGEVYKNIRNLWCARFVRRVISVLVRTPLRSSTLRLVNFTIPQATHSGCIIVTCHTPWKRLLVQWCLETDFALIISGGKWTHRKKRIQRQGRGFKELRDIVKYLQQNGRIVITADAFNNLNNCPVQFLGRDLNASLLPARLARIAEVSLIAAIPAFRNGAIRIDSGPQFDFKMKDLDSCSVMQNLISFFDSEIKKDPCTWPSFVK